MQDKRGEQKQLFRDVFLKRSKYLQSKQSLKEREVYVLIHDFFKEFITVDYEFTEQELKEELKKVYLEDGQRKRSEELLSKAFKIQYTDSTLSEKELRDLLKDFNRLVMQLIRNDKKQPVLSSIIDKITGKTKTPQIDCVPAMPLGFNNQVLPKVAPSHEPESKIEEASVIERKNEVIEKKAVNEPVKTILSKIQIIEDDNKGEEKVHINWSDDEPVDNDKKSQWADEMNNKISGKADSDKIEKQNIYSDVQEKTHRKKTTVSPGDRMNELLKETHDTVSINIEKAKKLYKQMHLIYSNLDPAAKEVYYQQVNDIYSSIHKAHSEKHL